MLIALISVSLYFNKSFVISLFPLLTARCNNVSWNKQINFINKLFFRTFLKIIINLIKCQNKNIIEICEINEI